VNFKKLMIGVVAVVVLICVWQFFTRVDRSNPVAVATAFTKALKGRDTGRASKFYIPDQAAAWREKTDDSVHTMRSGATERLFERIPDAPAFSEPVTAAGKTIVVSADKSFALEMKQIDGKWYVAKTDFQ